MEEEKNLFTNSLSSAQFSKEKKRNPSFLFLIRQCRLSETSGQTVGIWLFSFTFHV